MPVGFVGGVKSATTTDLGVTKTAGPYCPALPLVAINLARTHLLF
jgi:hypothetical protein